MLIEIVFYDNNPNSYRIKFARWLKSKIKTMGIKCVVVSIMFSGYKKSIYIVKH